MAAVTLTSVSRLAGRSRIVDDVSFSVPDGAVCALVGPTGAGKSTLLRLIAGRLDLTSGEIEIGGAARQSWRRGPEDLAELIDPSALPRSGVFYDAIAGGLKARGLKRREAREDALKGADALALGPDMPRRMASASSGERTLLALARIFARPPKVLLLDEPFAALPPSRRIELRGRLRRLQRESRVTTIIATQDLDDALALADVVAVMGGGRLVGIGTPEEVYEAPTTLALARLFGAPPMNLIPVRANQTGLSLDDGTNLGGTSVMTAATFAWLGVRPEHLAPLPEDSLAPGGAKFPIVVDDVERAPGGFLVHGALGEHRLAARLADKPRVGSGGRLLLGAPKERLHMFDAATGERL